MKKMEFSWKRLHFPDVTPIILALTLGGAGFATTPQAAESQIQQPAAQDDAEKIAAALEAIAPEIDNARKALEAATVRGAEAPPALQRTVDLLEQTRIALGQQRAALEKSGKLRQAKAELTRKIELLGAGEADEKRPFSFTLLDSLRDQFLTERAKRESTEAAVAAAEAGVAQARGDFEQKRQARLLAKEQVETNRDAAKAAQLVSAQRLAVLANDLAEAVLRQRQFELANQNLALEIYGLQQTYRAEKIALIKKDAPFTAEDLQNQLQEIDKRQESLERERSDAQTELKYFDESWSNANRRLDRITEAEPALAEEVIARRIAAEARRTRIERLTSLIGSLAAAREMWNRRFEISRGGMERAGLSTWYNETRTVIAQVDRDEVVAIARLAELRQDLATLESRMAAPEAPPGAEVQRWLREQRLQMQYHIRVYDEYLSALDVQRRLASKLLDEIQDTLGHFSLRGFWEGTWNRFLAVWKYSIVLDAEKESSITVGRVVTFLFLVIGGFFLSRLISRFLGSTVIRSSGLNRDATLALQSLLFYILLLIFTITALHMVNVPLTVFTLMGGAIAIGVGFGAQNLINNFISGWILIAERPVRIGDLVEIEGVMGHVKAVGARCTNIRRSDGVDMLVPNSLMLERNLVNWTLSDAHIRTSIRVGVVYGSPTDQVARLLMRVVQRSRRVLPDRTPTVIFDDFGDNSLNFEVFFWIRATEEMDLRRARSDIRFEIDRVFRTAGIVIAFPQRDVHLDSVRPIDVRMVEAPAKQTPGEESPQQRGRVTVLRRLDLFLTLSVDIIEDLARGLTERWFEPNQTIVRQGEAGASLFILVSGLLKVTADLEGRPEEVGQINPGEFVGEMSLLTGEPRFATVTAISRSQVFEIDKQILAPILEQHEEVMQLLCDALAARKAKTEQFRDSASQPAGESEKGFVADLRRRMQSFFGMSD